MSKKCLIAFDTICSSTNKAASRLKALIGGDQHVEVRHFDQAISLSNYGSVVIRSSTRREKPSTRTLEFIEGNKRELASQQVCCFLTCGDNDATVVAKAPRTAGPPDGRAGTVTEYQAGSHRQIRRPPVHAAPEPAAAGSAKTGTASP